MATQQYREVKRKAAVGERIKIVAASYTMGRYDNGDEFTVNHVDRDDDVYVRIDGKDRLICLSEFVVLEPIAQPITPSPLGTSFLSSDPLYVAFRQFVADNADGIRAILPQIEPQLSAEPPVRVAPIKPDVLRKLTRAEVIAKATADVAELLAQNYPTINGGEGAWFSKENDPFITVTDRVDFVVNRDKRTVTALIRYVDGNKVWRKATAKCAPDDVFHAEIGKAIALRRALGLALPTEYTDAPKPEKAEAGAVIRKVDGVYIGETRVIDAKAPNYSWACRFTNGKHSELKNCAIIDDTDVDYTEVAA
ncbi:hypothetical protein [Paenibacillus odorifer]|uniref:hypothetical protein n=1 Tax=Paenibacillus TaxID=44249 RepID=UPI00096F6C57|nr:hypothetical protein [Paenibacillus odorifer]OMD02527.1 hypothetical protein BJP46_15610 [Paenibacillus odorifer]